MALRPPSPLSPLSSMPRDAAPGQRLRPREPETSGTRCRPTRRRHPARTPPPARAPDAHPALVSPPVTLLVRHIRPLLPTAAPRATSSWALAASPAALPLPAPASPWSLASAVPHQHSPNEALWRPSLRRSVRTSTSPLSLLEGAPLRCGTRRTSAMCGRCRRGSRRAAFHAFVSCLWVPLHVAHRVLLYLCAGHSPAAASPATAPCTGRCWGPHGAPGGRGGGNDREASCKPSSRQVEDDCPAPPEPRGEGAAQPAPHS